MDLLPIAVWRQWWDSIPTCDEVVTAARASGFVLPVAVLRERGVTRARQRWAIDHERWTRAGYGMIAPVDLRRELPEIGGEHVLARRRHAVASAAAALARPPGAVSGCSAAVMHGLPTMSVPRVPELVARDETGIGPRTNVHLMAGTLDSPQLTVWFGIDLSHVARTLVDLGRRHRRDAIMAADAALREGVVTVEQIDIALRFATRWPGVTQAREVLALADARAESALESVTRLAIHDAGLPDAELNYWLGPDRVDFYWPQCGVVLEADGRVKYTSDERWAEKVREQRLRRLGLRVERVVWKDVLRDWPRTEHILRSALRTPAHVR